MANAFVIPPAGSAGTFTTSETTKRSKRLSEYEADDLRYVWAGVSADMGMHSAHGALEARLLMAPPRDVAAPILEELARLGGWVCEGRVLRLVTMDTSTTTPRGVPGELRRAMKELVKVGRVERRPSEMPAVKSPAERTNGEQQQIDDWTGFEVRRSMTTALRMVPMTREERWAAEDLELERSHHMLHGSETHHATGDYEPPENVQFKRVDRARRVLAYLNERDRKVLRAMYGEHRITETAEVEAVRFVVGGSETDAMAAIELACGHYRDVRQALKQERIAATLRGQR